MSEISDVKETMRKFILLDILETLLEVRKQIPGEEIECYISSAFSGGVWDRKLCKQIENDL